MDDLINVLTTIIPLGAGVAIDAYIMPTDSMRYGLSYVSELLGYSESYFLRLTKSSSKKLKALYSKGYTGDIIDVKAARIGKRGATVAKTISFDDFCILVEYESIEEKNPKAIALLTAAFRDFLRSRTLAAFGLPNDSQEERDQAFWEAFQERETIWVEDREEINELVLLGDENIDLAEYDTAVAQWETQVAYGRYLDIA